MSDQLLSPQPTYVEIGATIGAWFVRVADCGAVTLYTFDGRRTAIDFAEETRRKLMLGGFVREERDE